MQEVEKVIDTVLNFLNEYDKPMDIVLAVLATLYLRSIKHNFKSNSPTDVSKKSNVNKAVRLAKVEYEGEFKKGLELYYSGKSREEMTEEEQVLFDKTSEFLGG